MKYLHLCLFFVFSHIALGALPTMDLSLYPNYEDTTTNNENPIDVVFFEKTTEGELIPTCRVPVNDYPEMLSADLPFSILNQTGFKQAEPASQDATSEVLSTSKQNLKPENHALNPYDLGGEQDSVYGKAGFDLEPCAPELSAKLSETAKHFQLYPQVAVLRAGIRAGVNAISKGLNAIKNSSTVSWIGVANILSCVMVGGMTGSGTHLYRTGDEPFPYNGEGIAGTGILISPVLGAVQTWAYWPRAEGNLLSHKIVRRTAIVSSMIMGVVCSVAGGFVGYFTSENHNTENELIVAKKILKELDKKLEVANEVSSKYYTELSNTKNELEQAKRENAEKQATLTNTQNNLEQAKLKNAEQQAELEASKGVVNELSNALREAYRQSVEQKAQNSQELGNNSPSTAKQETHHPPIVEQRAQSSQELGNSSNTDAKQGNHHPPVAEQRAQSSQGPK